MAYLRKNSLSILGCQLLRYIFYDPDGHSLEYKAVLEDEARPYLDPMYLSEWEGIK
ncbi:hypothetical protein DFO70_101208 [Cytobacillus firmus]|uniref:Uncharacterized protein n=2 Tax=Cytobacillus TaxID=2675230 RepID=A0A366K509_CYTFI|nr:MULTISPECIES: hypothetical protein [Cytobacillus]RBP96402.1 hypothetical protein DFO70_101208 [Cytobacillus firmus]TDX45872.1 hypothetical protein DFO72_102349 [Cytobacillus oceanisediminis]